MMSSIFRYGFIEGAALRNSPFDRSLCRDNLLGGPLLARQGRFFLFPVIFTDSSFCHFAAIELKLPDIWWLRNSLDYTDAFAATT